MPKITLLTVGRARHKAFKLLEEEYATRLKHYTDFQIITVSDSPQKNIEIRKEEEAQFLDKKIPSGALIILLDEKGKHITTKELSLQIQKWDNQAVKNIIFIIGGAFGVSEFIKQKAATIMTLSALTLPHEMARVLTIEQLYRAYTIIRGEKYHH